MGKRKKRKATKNVDFLEPIDITQFGSKDDPCFGKLYNLSAEECRRCGDSELCAVVFSQNMKLKRKKVEKTSRFKDLELDIPKEVENWVLKKLDSGMKKHVIMKKAQKLFGVEKLQIRQIYKKHKK